MRWQWRLKSLSCHHYRERGKHIGRQGRSYVSHLCCQQAIGTYLEGEKKASIDENTEHEEGTYLWIMTRYPNSTQTTDNATSRLSGKQSCRWMAPYFRYSVSKYIKCPRIWRQVGQEWVANHNEGDSEFGSALRPKFPPLIRSRDHGRMGVRWAIPRIPFIIWALGQNRKER